MVALVVLDTVSFSRTREKYVLFVIMNGRQDIQTMFQIVIRRDPTEILFVGPDLSTAAVDVARLDFGFEVAMMSFVIASLNIHVNPATDSGVRKT